MFVQDDLSRPSPQALTSRHSIPENWMGGESMQPFEAPAISRCERKGPLPLSLAQQRMWFLDQLESSTPADTTARAYRLRGRLNTAALQQSLDEIVRRHEVLRTTFTSANGQPVQVIAPALSLTLPEVDLQGLPETRQWAELQRLIAEETQRPFDLAQGPLLRTRLLCLSPEEYVLILTMHQIVSDAWSIAVFTQELTTLYRAFSTGKPSPLSELPIQHADFAHWQRQSLQGNSLESDLEYWKQQLGGELPVLQLPTDRPRPPRRTGPASRCSLVLSPTLSEALEALSRQEEAPLFITLLATFKTMLYRLSGQGDLVVGFRTDGRNQVDTQGLIGPLGNTLMLRTHLSDAMSFQELLGRVYKIALEAYIHRGMPFEKLVEELQPERDLSRTPLHQVGFRMLDPAESRLALPDLTVEPVSVPDTHSELDLTLLVRKQGEELQLELVYRADLFDRDRMVEMLGQLEHLLMQIVDQPENPIQAYSLVTARGQRLLPDPRAILAEPWHEPITALVASWMNDATKHPAIHEGDRTWTYTELAHSAQALAQALLLHGVERGDVVGVAGRRSYGLIAGMVGVLLSGGVLMNLDRNLPRHQQQLMLQEAKAKCLLYTGTPRPTDEWLWESMMVIRVDPDSGQPIDLKRNMPSEGMNLPQVTAEDAAYLFFTSGSTGIPKGVLGWHKGLSHFLRWQRQTFSIGPTDRSAQLTGLSFDVVLRDIFTPLTAGATLCLPPEEGLLEPMRLLSWMERERISMLHTVPSLAQSWLPHVPPGASLRSLRWVFFAGEPLTDTLVHRWRKAFPESGEIVNLYGPTETTLAKCYFLVPPEPIFGVQPVGSPLPETQALVLAENNQLCGIGEPGQIVLRTPFRSLGYINAPEENQRRFVKNPFRDDERDMLYYTGDRGRYRPDGTLDILGRVDHQVKLRGVRIELGGIETVLSQHAAVWDSVAVVREDVPGDKRLVAYVTTKPGQTLTTPGLRRFLKQKLPEAMIPSALVVLDTLPLTPNGKVDRRALPAPQGLRPELDATYMAPRTELERTISAIWQEVLHIEKAGVDDSFFDLGGHSLLLIEVQSRLRQVLDRDISVIELFEYPTVGSLAQHLSQEQGERPSLPQVQDRTQIRRELMRQRRQSRTRH